MYYNIPKARQDRREICDFCELRLKSTNATYGDKDKKNICWRIVSANDVGGRQKLFRTIWPVAQLRSHRFSRSFAEARILARDSFNAYFMKISRDSKIIIDQQKIDNIQYIQGGRFVEVISSKMLWTQLTQSPPTDRTRRKPIAETSRLISKTLDLTPATPILDIEQVKVIMKLSLENSGGWGRARVLDER
ncbi:unnamed protein product [Trichogramma brassicae]|uniref:Uncharacterized protein n=1 Tax=Trichogramma brassicae TaxID=86971 RepID=A0A6H5IWC7_9HYME|nr:unnamed protein product [Trichogramma brassicae]